MKSVIKRQCVRLEEAGDEARTRRGPARPAGAGAASAVPADAEGTALRLIRVDGQVRAIEVTCACGDVSVIELDYEDHGGGAAPSSAQTSAPNAEAAGGAPPAAGTEGEGATS